MQHFGNYLSNIYSKTVMLAIMEAAMSGRWKIYFLSDLTTQPQVLTMVQLAGIMKFSCVNINLETGQTYQAGLEMNREGMGTYQDVGLADLIVDEETLKLIKKRIFITITGPRCPAKMLNTFYSLCNCMNSNLLAFLAGLLRFLGRLAACFLFHSFSNLLINFCSARNFL